MSRKILVAICLIAVLAVALSFYVQTTAMETLVLEIAYTVMPELGEKNWILEDVDLTFEAETYFENLPSYQLQKGYHVQEGRSKIAIVDLLINFSMQIEILPFNSLEPWRTYMLNFSSLTERKIQVFMNRNANVTLGDKANVVIDARVVVWYKGQAPTIDKSIHKVLTVKIPTPR